MHRVASVELWVGQKVTKLNIENANSKLCELIAKIYFVLKSLKRPGQVLTKGLSQGLGLTLLLLY